MLKDTPSGLPTVIVHTVHNAHHLLQTCLRFLFATLRDEFSAESRNHALEWPINMWCRPRSYWLTMICPKGPIFMMFWNCSYMSRKVNWPNNGETCKARSIDRSTNYHVSIWPTVLHCLPTSNRWLFPSSLGDLPYLDTNEVMFSGDRSRWRAVDSPKSLLMNGFVLKGSKSSICSPVPMKVMGLFVAATLEGFVRVLTTIEERERERSRTRWELHHLWHDCRV